jgi:hypothetical protein
VPVISQGDYRSTTVPKSYPDAQVRAYDRGVRSPFQAGHEGSIPFARAFARSTFARSNQEAPGNQASADRLFDH